METENQNSEQSQIIDVEKVVNHWIQTSEEDYQAMLSLYDSKVYNWSLFLGHISVEKLLKALYVKTHHKHAVFTHKLYRLTELIGIDISEDNADKLDELTSFNLNARYDDYKKEFYKKCTKEYTEIWIQNIKDLRLWIKRML